MKAYSALLIIISLTTNIFSQVQFTPHTITTGADGTTSVYAADVDGDGDMDVLSASSFDDKIAWYENDGNENFTLHTITTDAVGASSVYAKDVDDDEDMDVLSASQIDDKIAWYENDGNENFTPHTITTIADAPSLVYPKDVDGDGDIDVLSASSGDNKITWYENMLISSISDYENPPLNNFILSQNYPNPFNPSTKIIYSVPQSSNVVLKVFDVLGSEVETLVNNEKPAGSYEVEFDATGLPSGIYFYQLRAGNFVETKKMILMK